MILAAALLLPSLFWDKGPETIEQLRHAQIERISVPSSIEDVMERDAGHRDRHRRSKPSHEGAHAGR